MNGPGVMLRAGAQATPLFVFPGGGGDPLELSPLAQALPSGLPVVALAPEPVDARKDAAVEAMAERAAAQIRVRQPHGPYRLLGYSFGGLVALETGRRLRASGETVAFLGLVDTIYDRRWWPAGAFALAQARRALGHVARIARQPAGHALPELAARARALAGRLAERSGAAPASADADGLPDLCLAAAARHRPKPYVGPVSLFASRGRDFGVDPVRLWAPFIADLQVRRVDAGHLDLVRAPAAVAALAAAVGAALAQSAGQRPIRALLAASFTWISTARLALALSEAGFAVEAVCPRRHSLWRLGFLGGVHRLSVLAPRASLARAIDAARPDIIIACDDPTTQALHALHAAADPATGRGAWLRERLAASLSAPETYDFVYSRAAVMVMAEEEGVRAPASARVGAAADLAAWLSAHPGPAVLKCDGSWGGRDVAVIRGPDGADRAYRRLSRPRSLVRGLKRLLVDGDAGVLRDTLGGRRPSVSVQAFIDGVPGNVAAACRDGEVLAAVCAEVLQSDGATGPATVVKVIRHPEMEQAVRRMAGRLRLNGLCGFDFMLQRGTGHAYLIEINPRATPTAHLIAADGGDLAAALHAALRDAPPPRRRPTCPGRTVALFPQELRRDPASAFLQAAGHDVPWHAPELISVGLAHARVSPAALKGLVPPPGHDA